MPASWWLCVDKGLHMRDDGWQLVELTAVAYLPRPTCFHLINIYGVVGPAAVVVKLYVPSHTLDLDLTCETDMPRNVIALDALLVLRCMYPWSN